MSLQTPGGEYGTPDVPRASGDEPRTRDLDISDRECSPRERG